MAQAAEYCATVLAASCASPAFLQTLCTRLLEDRSAKLRCHCCRLLTQVCCAQLCLLSWERRCGTCSGGWFTSSLQRALTGIGHWNSIAWAICVGWQCDVLTEWRYNSN